ncbi:hypothetical protein J1N35_016049 [Gossypium stocksii]|uniref:Uncharacterized protein n=1 Tax=Gossypium stocksii TaxID=47602 RepID=A0A9D3VY89_9ROSI|nr:hypothetical protein J1N35_016049 [Gossypium stocksii]
MAFNSRVAFCLNMNNEASAPTELTQGKIKCQGEKERQQQEQELAKHTGEDDDNEF